jgi:leucyl/phenylalanyl-tRNA--protein transferase
MTTTERFFPDPSEANEFGVVCAGAVPHPELLKEAYRTGIFPWPHKGYPLLWFSPDPRFVLLPRSLHLHRSLKKAMRKTTLVIKADTAFRDVMAGCAKAKRAGQTGTWITRDMIEGYCALHDEGLCHSIEAWDGDRLVGGLYGVSFGSVFFGESMFTRAPDASKIAFATLMANLIRQGFTLVDCQSYTDHLARFGAIEMPRPQFLAALREGLEAETKVGPWSLPLQPAAAVDWLEAQGIG